MFTYFGDATALEWVWVVAVFTIRLHIVRLSTLRLPNNEAPVDLLHRPCFAAHADTYFQGPSDVLCPQDPS